MTVNDWARILFSLGAVFAIAGGAVGAIYYARAAQAAKKIEKTYGAMEDLVDPEKQGKIAAGAARWAFWAFALVATGVVLSSIASLILIP